MNIVKIKQNDLKSPSILQILSFNNLLLAMEQSSLCGSVYKIQILNEYIYESLEERIENYKKQNKRFSENELLKLIDYILGGLIILSRSDMRHGFIQPRNIFCSDFYKITDIRFLTDMYEYEYQMLGFTNTCYLAPSLFDQLGKRTLNPIYNYEKSEIFSLALTTLEAALLHNIYDIYDYQRFTIKPEKLDSYIGQLNYSPTFLNLLKQMLEIQDKSRSNVIQVANSLQKQLNEKSYSYYLLNQYNLVSNTRVVEQKIEKHNSDYQQIPIIPVTTTPITPVKPSYDKDHLQATKDTDYKIYTHTQSVISPLDDKLKRFHNDLINVQSQFHTIHNQYEDEKYLKDYSINYIESHSKSPRIITNRNPVIINEPYTQRVIEESSQRYAPLTNESPVVLRHQYTFQESQKHSERYQKPPPSQSKLDKVSADDFKIAPSKSSWNFSDLEKKLNKQNHLPVFFESPLDKTLEQQDKQSTWVQARLPQSDLIHMHSDTSLYLNDLFLDSRKETKYF